MAEPIRRALISVSDKTGVVDFCRALSARGIALLSTGGTFSLLEAEGVSVTEVSAHTGFPEIMAGRVKTLHPKIHGGILGRRGVDDQVMDEHGIEPIDLLVVNLYPFVETISRPDCTFDLAVENIDIGGPAMLRAAAKNHAHVAVVVEPADYDRVLTGLDDGQGSISETERRRLALKAFQLTARYDAAIAAYLSAVQGESFPEWWQTASQHKKTLRYGENPHQQAAFFTDVKPLPGTVAYAAQLQGKELSYNNIADTDTALECVKSFTEQVACVIVKHANPCGVAVADSVLAAYDSAYQTDPTSAFGGIIAFNRALDKTTAQAIVQRQFVEVIIAPEINRDALEVLAQKPNIRVLAAGAFSAAPEKSYDLKKVAGGLLVQDLDTGSVTLDDLKVVSQRQPDADELRDLLFVWKVAKFVKSNAIVYGRGGQTLGIGAGQMSRVYSARIAGIKAADEKLDLNGSVMASDAFFPFRDGIDSAAECGVRAVIQPGGSMRDQEVIDAANEHGMAMVFTGMRHFRH